VSRRPEVLIVGGGVVGVCCAYYLADRGLRPLVVERDEICSRSGSTYANAGLVVPSEVYPLAAPGVLGRGLRWLLDSSSPFWVAPRPDPALVRWLMLFRAACTDERMRARMKPLRELGELSSRLIAELADQPDGDLTYRKNGWLVIHEDDSSFAAGLADEEAAKRLGVLSEPWDAAQMRERIPQLRPGLAGGIFNAENGHVVPDRFVRALAERARALGAELLTQTAVLRLQARDGIVERVVTTRGTLRPRTLVLAAGAWSPGLARRLGLRLPIEPAKGYSITLPRPDGYPELPLYLASGHVCITPMEQALRLAGTMELSGFDVSYRPKRLCGIAQAARRVFTDGTLGSVGSGGPADWAAGESSSMCVWHGLRPLSPDGLPLIGRSAAYENLIVAGGHCMLGLSLGPATGHLVAQIASGAQPDIDLRPFAPDRFAAGRYAAGRGPAMRTPLRLPAGK
jgi:D-amino-acid dehydrogenase